MAAESIVRQAASRDPSWGELFDLEAEEKVSALCPQQGRHPPADCELRDLERGVLALERYLSLPVGAADFSGGVPRNELSAEQFPPPCFPQEPAAVVRAAENVVACSAWPRECLAAYVALLAAVRARTVPSYDGSAEDELYAALLSNGDTKRICALFAAVSDLILQLVSITVRRQSVSRRTLVAYQRGFRCGCAFARAEASLLLPRRRENALRRLRACATALPLPSSPEFHLPPAPAPAPGAAPAAAPLELAHQVATAWLSRFSSPEKEGQRAASGVLPPLLPLAPGAARGAQSASSAFSPGPAGVAAAVEADAAVTPDTLFNLTPTPFGMGARRHAPADAAGPPPPAAEAAAAGPAKCEAAADDSGAGRPPPRDEVQELAERLWPLPPPGALRPRRPPRPSRPTESVEEVSNVLLSAVQRIRTAADASRVVLQGDREALQAKAAQLDQCLNTANTAGAAARAAAWSGTLSFFQELLFLAVAVVVFLATLAVIAATSRSA